MMIITDSSTGEVREVNCVAAIALKEIHFDGLENNTSAAEVVNELGIFNGVKAIMTLPK
jgi:hypothetical protein